MVLRQKCWDHAASHRSTLIKFKAITRFYLSSKAAPPFNTHTKLNRSRIHPFEGLQSSDVEDAFTACRKIDWFCFHCREVVVIDLANKKLLKRTIIQRRKANKGSG